MGRCARIHATGDGIGKPGSGWLAWREIKACRFRSIDAGLSHNATTAPPQAPLENAGLGRIPELLDLMMTMRTESMKTSGFTTALTAGMILAGMATNTYGFEYSHFPVTFDPPEPQAFQPFTVSFRAFALADRPIAIQVDGNAIIIDFAGQATRFPTSPPPEVNVQARIEGLAPGDYVVKVFQNFSPDRRGQDRLDNAEKEPDWPLTVSEAPPAVPVHAFYNAENRHYFITASDIERNGILDGKAGSDWIVLDEDFQAWPAEGPAPEAARAVCRFYSAMANSHFYAVEGAECEHLKREGSGWAYEGIAFRTLTATAGSCPAGTDQIWRLYNDRAAASDSNHRFTSSASDYRSMIAAGWIGEGAVFCSPR